MRSRWLRNLRFGQKNKKPLPKTGATLNLAAATGPTGLFFAHFGGRFGRGGSNCSRLFFLAAAVSVGAVGNLAFFRFDVSFAHKHCKLK